MKTVNEYVAVELFSNTEEKKEVSRGIDITDRLVTKLISTRVLLDSKNYKAGTLLYFRSDIKKLPESIHKYQLRGLVFLLLPESQVVAYDDE